MLDVIVIGGGPAGATAAALLARGGASVLVLEKERFPRFHIGESLLPRSVPTLQALGVDLESSVFRYKGGAEFFDEANGDFALYPFADALPGGPCASHAYQVERAAFDAALLESALRWGARLSQERVVALDAGTNSVRVKSDQGEHEARYCVDATGQDAFLARRDRTMKPVDDFGRAAVFTHFADLSDEAIGILGPDGNIKVLVWPDGWNWVIPLTERRVSFGAVTRRGTVTPELLEQTLAASPVMQRITRGARRLETRVVRNFSFRNTGVAGSRYTSVGDAACFLDPVFSSGVCLALLGAEALSERLLPALAGGTESDPTLMEPVRARMSHAYAAVSSLVRAFYHTRIVKNLFFAKKPVPEMRAGLISMLAGDVFREDNPFQNALMRSKRRWDVGGVDS